MMVDMSPFPVGKPMALQPGLSCVLAPNPSPMTFWGTNTYLVGDQSLAIIDPGPNNESHLEALVAAIAGRHVSHILLTHSHLDHSPLARPLAERVDAPILAFGPSGTGQSPVMAELAARGLTGGGEGIDKVFVPDRVVSDGQVITGPWGQVQALHTPGHIGNHLCFQWQDAIFTGDHVMGWASSLVSPPDGDLTDFMRSCRKLQGLTANTYYPGHGPPVTNPSARLDWLVSHRLGREQQILDVLSNGQMSIPVLTRRIYDDVAPALLPAAERNVFAHLIDLVGRGLVTALPQLSVLAEFRRQPDQMANVEGKS
ncbi:MAG: MBL fold metallo-hydrolase [Pseudomonadota bacterium]